MTRVVRETDFPTLKLCQRGKVRDMYDLGDAFLMVATDRMSAFDVIMPDPIPGKGKVLTQISLYWFDIMASLVNNHVITANINDYPEASQPYAAELEGRSILVKKAEPLPIECVVRGYITGSGWKSYCKDGSVCGIQLPEGLVESDQLSEPIFTPSTKEALGKHDINIDFDEMTRRIGAPLAQQVKDLSLSIYKKGANIAEEKGILIADTKFEFGILDGEIILIDEVLTPDSSRFWPKSTYVPGGPQQSFDKQYLRDYLLSLDWDQSPPGPKLPQDVIDNTRAKYVEALALLTGNRHGL
ncbi:Phosphoribosylaminoimidazole-succinocarboxamide synthase [Desulfosarcina cetonica]|uniref:phosphoribosylaminoimidazolesuccinocarboxamide synthase n=1 Tax=Desulfosarcina cetonica TaxID=90730 RepID=UPI0006D06737|nr:phosphoribosylaminoimidazolesuccinocarboxamide synthase [Desulfosarcina cetonica]VTR64951.1 Phosphoribosylaminoimidazole-succinocarboxamide synthase [Desulfosarcina cetonica]